MVIRRGEGPRSVVRCTFIARTANQWMEIKTIIAGKRAPCRVLTALGVEMKQLVWLLDKEGIQESATIGSETSLPGTTNSMLLGSKNIMLIVKASCLS